MNLTLEIKFSFSACFEEGDGSLAAHNYALYLVTSPLDRPAEKCLRANVEQNLIGRIASRDLGRDVEFLKGKKLTEFVLLSEFQTLVARLIAPSPVYRLALERADGTRLTWAADAS